MPIIHAENVSVCYVTGDLKNIGLKEYIIQKIKGDYKVEQFWANKYISFSLEPGDMMAIIGSNGAGKSTLLKAISGVMKPSYGKISVQGKIAALLELASGFDGELTVKENTYLRGAMLGYTRDFMDAQYAEIIRFAELEHFQERPFKQLSSGMKSRLAFAIASLVSPDIIILDEVLSVGDGSFKEKSAAKMKEILASGVTGILVSHSAAQVRQLCNKVLWLDHGNQIGFSDEVDIYCNAYEEFLKTGELPQNEAQLQEMGYRKILRQQVEMEKRRAAEEKRQEELARKKRQEELVRKKLEEELARKKREEEKRREELARTKIHEAQLKQEIELKRKEEKNNWLKERQQLIFRNNVLLKENQEIKEMLKAEQINFVGADLVSEIIGKFIQYFNCARIDIKNQGCNDNDLEFIEISDAAAKKQKPKWFSNNGIGYVFETREEEFLLSIRAKGDGELKLWLRGLDVRHKDKRVPIMVDYTSLLVNGEEQLENMISVWHDKSYFFSKNLKDGEIVDIVISQRHKEF